MPEESGRLGTARTAEATGVFGRATLGRPPQDSPPKEQTDDPCTAQPAAAARTRIAQPHRRVTDVPVQPGRRLCHRLASGAPRAVRGVGRRAGDPGGHACRAPRPHHPRLPGAVLRRERGGAGAGGRLLPPSRPCAAGHPDFALGPQGLGAPALGRPWRSADGGQRRLGHGERVRSTLRRVLAAACGARCRRHGGGARGLRPIDAARGAPGL